MEPVVDTKEEEVVLAESPVLTPDKCLNCENDATVQEEGKTDNIFCSKTCQEIYRYPNQVCILIDTKHTAYTLDTPRIKVTPQFMFCLVGNDNGEIEMDSVWTRIIRVESGTITVNVFDRNKALLITYYLKPGTTDQIIIPRTVYYTLSSTEKDQTAKVSIILNKQ